MLDLWGFCTIEVKALDKAVVTIIYYLIFYYISNDK